MKKLASKVAETAQIQPKSQLLFHKNLPPRDFSIMTFFQAESLGIYVPQWTDRDIWAGFGPYWIVLKISDWAVKYATFEGIF